MKPVVRLFSMVYGEAYIRRYVELMLPSLLQPGSVPALVAKYDVRFSLYTTPDSLDQLKAAIVTAMRSAGPAAEAMLGLFEIERIDENPDGLFDEATRQDPVRLRRLLNRRTQAKCLVREISTCLEMDAVMVPCGADCFYGDGSIANMVGAALAHNTSVSALCLRVDELEFKELMSVEPLPIANERLAAMAIQTLHEAARASVRGSRRQLSYLFGIDIVPLSPRQFAITYRTPSVLATRFNKSDLAYFMMMGDFREWDQGWTQKLISERRFQFLGSTDLALLVEPTPKTTGQVGKYLEMDDHLHGLVDVRDYQRRGLHNETMRNFVVGVRTDRDVAIRPY